MVLGLWYAVFPRGTLWLHQLSTCVGECFSAVHQGSIRVVCGTRSAALPMWLHNLPNMSYRIPMSKTYPFRGTHQIDMSSKFVMEPRSSPQRLDLETLHHAQAVMPSVRSCLHPQPVWQIRAQAACSHGRPLVVPPLATASTALPDRWVTPDSCDAEKH